MKSRFIFWKCWVPYLRSTVHASNIISDCYKKQTIVPSNASCWLIVLVSVFIKMHEINQTILIVLCRLNFWFRKKWHSLDMACSYFVWILTTNFLVYYIYATHEQKSHKKYNMKRWFNLQKEFVVGLIFFGAVKNSTNSKGTLFSRISFGNKQNLTQNVLNAHLQTHNTIQNENMARKRSKMKVSIFWRKIHHKKCKINFTLFKHRSRNKKTLAICLTFLVKLVKGS